MKTLTKTNCLPLTQEDIFVLRGKPVAKRRTPLSGFSSLYEEEWIYYTPIYKDGFPPDRRAGRGDTKEERFIFKNGKLVGYKTE